MSEEAPPAAHPPVLIRPLPIVFGLFAGAGIAVLLQQYAVTPLTWTLLLGSGLTGAVVIGIGLPTLLMYVFAKRGDPVVEQEEAP